MSAKRKLLVLAGAGASVDFGMPSVSAVGELLSRAASPYFSLSANPGANLYDFIKDELSAYWSRTSPLIPPVNYEDVLYVITILESYYPAGLYTGPLGAFMGIRQFPDVNYFDNRHRRVDADIFRHLASELVDRILLEFRTRCKGSIPNIGDLRCFFSVLTAEFDVAVVTTNYDNLIYQALEPIETGFDQAGMFDPGRVLGRSTWPCILHLHGSVHFDMDTVGNNLHAIKWQADLNAQFQPNSSSRSSNMASGGNKFPTSAIVVGGNKTDQILRLPFRTYYSEMDRLIHESDALLCCGFSFADNHIKDAFGSYRDGRDRPVVVVDCAANGQMLAGSSFGPSDTAAQRMINMSGIMPNQMVALGYRIPGTVDKLVAAKDFQRHSIKGKRLSIWYNGMLEACKNAAGVITELS